MPRTRRKKYPKLGTDEVLEILTRECRDLIDALDDKGWLNREGGGTVTVSQRNDLVRQHFSGTQDDYNIAVEEYLPGIDQDERVDIVDRVLSSIEYQPQST